MHLRRVIYLMGTLLLTVLIIAVSVSTVFSAPATANSKFKSLWEWSDKPVDEIPNMGRGFTWGPTSIAITQENYQEAPGGKRQVQYFDKSRMELSPDGTYVTNGLLTKELVTGQRQDGNSTFTSLAPSQVQVAGDDNSGGGNSVSPSYASFKNVVTFNPGENTAPSRTNQVANLAINKAGSVSTLTTLPAQVLIGSYESTLGHNVPTVFVDYQNLVWKVWNGAALVSGKVYTDNPIANVFGYPISEPYWIRAVVAGQEKDVLVQLYERRVLTYTPSNSAEFRVEMGNIGVHYYKWRYDSAPPETTPGTTPITTPGTTPPAETTPPGQETPIPTTIPSGPASGQHLTGTGDRDFTDVKLVTGIARFTATHNGQNDFMVTLWDSDNNLVSQPFFATGSYQGSVLVDVSQSGSYSLQVQADGDWTVDFQDMNQLNAEPAKTGSAFHGSGESAIKINVSKTGDTTFKLDHTGLQRFSVLLYDSSGILVDILADGEGNYSTETPIATVSGDYYIYVIADGSWNISYS